MAQLQERLVEALVKDGVITEDQVPKVQNAIKSNLPPPVYKNAAVFLGLQRSFWHLAVYSWLDLERRLLMHSGAH
jgi:hypothetical protein